MKHLKLYFISAALFVLPIVSRAQDIGIADGGVTAGANQFGRLLNNIIEFTTNVIIPFILFLGFIIFVWGMFQYFIVGAANDEAKEKGKSFMLYVFLGFIMIFIFWGLLNIIGNLTGLQGETFDNSLSPKPPTIP